MLGNPVDYLTRRNNALAAVGTTTTDTYNTKLDDLVDSLAGDALEEGDDITAAMVAAQDAEHLAVRNLPWVKQVTAGLAAMVQAAEVEMVDLNFPIKNEAKKFQKSINKRTMAGKKELIKEDS